MNPYLIITLKQFVACIVDEFHLKFCEKYILLFTMPLFLIDELVSDIETISNVSSAIFLFCAIVLISSGPNQK